MNTTELTTAMRKLRLSGMASTLEVRMLEAQSRDLPPIDFISALVTDELNRRSDRLIERRTKQAAFRDHGKTLASFDFDFNKKTPRALVFELGTCRFIDHREDVLLLGPPGTGKSHLAQALGLCAVAQGYAVRYFEAHRLIETTTSAAIAGERAQCIEALSRVALLIVDDLGMRRLPATAAEDLLELIMRRYEHASTIITSNRPVDDWGKLLGDTAAVTAMLDRLLHHGHVIQCGPRSFRTSRAACVTRANESTT